jgi:hypothetical protein
MSEGKKKNNSTLSYADCMLRLSDRSRSFHDMTDDDLDSIYACAFGRWAYHLTRDGYIQALEEKRKTMKDYD